LQKLQQHSLHLEDPVQLPKVLDEYALSQHRAQVALCLDVSATMHPLYASGKMQAFAEKILALGVFFDENDEIDVFLFGDETHYVGEMNLENFKDFIPTAKQKFISVGATEYDKVFRKVRKFYFPDAADGPRTEPLKSDGLPVYVMFVSDGTTLEEEATEKQLAYSTYEPIFWQFMALGKGKDDAGTGVWGWINRAFAQDFSFFQRLDDLAVGSKIDNSDFFNIPDLNALDDQKLYQLMMNEYPEWLELATKAGILTTNES
ncbi:MAG: VWA domain-containing protein, partial [Bacteroidota bacterium]